MRSSPILGSFICFGISIACWVAFVGVLAMLIVINGGDPIKVARHLLGLENRAARPAQRVARDNCPPTRNVPPRNVQAQQPNRSPRNPSKPPLTAAIWHGDVAEVQRVLDSGVDPNVPEDDKYPLATAIELRQTAIATLLLELGADIEATDGVSRTPLLWAADSDANDACEALLAAGAEIEAAERSGATALEVAVRCGNRALFELLIEKGASAKGDGILFQAISNWRGDDKMLKSLLAHGAELETSTIGGETPLLYAVAKRRLDAAKVLLAAGAKVNVAGPRKRTPLHLAVLNKDVSFIKLLLDAGADVKAKDERGATAHDIAQQVGNALPAELMQRLQ